MKRITSRAKLVINMEGCRRNLTDEFSHYPVNWHVIV